jgi:parvulin-like peptidyl-prolyl isomerase
MPVPFVLRSFPALLTGAFVVAAASAGAADPATAAPATAAPATPATATPGNGPAFRGYDRVIAIVGDRAIFQTDLLKRARPFHAKLADVPEKDRATLTKQVYRELTERMVDEVLERDFAQRNHITVTAQDVDQALQTVAAQNNADLKTVFAEAKKIGLSEDEYRTEIERQILEGKLMALLGGATQIQVDDAEVKARYEELKKQVKNPGDLKDLATLAPMIKQQLAMEKVESFRRDFVARLRADTYVEIRVEAP